MWAYKETRIEAQDHVLPLKKTLNKTNAHTTTKPEQGQSIIPQTVTEGKNIISVFQKISNFIFSHMKGPHNHVVSNIVSCNATGTFFPTLIHIRTSDFEGCRCQVSDANNN